MRARLVLLLAAILLGHPVASWADPTDQDTTGNSTYGTTLSVGEPKVDVMAKLEAVHTRSGSGNQDVHYDRAGLIGSQSTTATSIGGQDPEKYKHQMEQWRLRLERLCASDSLAPSQTDLFNENCIPGDPADPADPVPVAAVPRPSPALLGGLAVAELTMPTPVPEIGPPPTINEWNMSAVGYPLWLWTDSTTTMASSASIMGETVMLTARRTAVSFDMGDGHTVSCQATTPWTTAVAPARESPTCGYRYQKASLPEGSYRVVAVAEWEVVWSVLGETGTIPIQKAAATDLPVGQLRSVITGR